MTTPDLTLSATEANPTPDAGRKPDAAMAPGGSAVPSAVEVLRKAIQAYLKGDYEGPRSRRPHGCKHGLGHWETCEACIDDHFRTALAAAALAADPTAEVEALRARAQDLEEALVGFRDERNQWRDRATAAEARVRVLERFVDYVLLWRDRGPPHGDPATAWSAVSGHPVVGQRARATLPQRDDMERPGDVG